MTKITWLGEDGDDVAGPSFTTCFDRRFNKGEAVDVDDKDTVERARKNPFFQVEGDDDPAGDDGLDDLSVAEPRERAGGRRHRPFRSEEVGNPRRAPGRQ